MTATNEENLAKAKILVMLKDLVGNKWDMSYNPCAREKIRHDAYRWFFSPESDFEDWCEMAGYDPKYVRGKAREAYDNGVPQWRARAGEGLRFDKNRKYRQKTGEKRTDQ